MKILVIPGWYPGKFHSTTGDFVMYQTQALIREGIDACVLYSDLSYKYLFSNHPVKHQIKFAVEKNVPTFRLEGFFPPKVFPFLLQKWAKQYEQLYYAYHQKYGQPNLIHAHTFLGGYVAMHLSQKFNLPYIVTEHNVDIITGKLKKWYIPLIKKVYNNAALVIAVSHFLKKSIQKKFSNNEVVVVPNFINTDLFCPQPKAKSDVTRFIAVGELLPIKGFDILLKAFYEMKKEGHQNIQLTIVGGGKEWKKLLKLREQLSLTKEVIFTGEQSQQQVATIMQQSDVFVLSSHLETFGIVVIEAMGCGLPVVATRCGGPEDVLNEKNGVLVLPNDIGELKKGLMIILQNHKMYKVPTIRAMVVNTFSSQQITKMMFSIYNNTIPSASP